MPERLFVFIQAELPFRLALTDGRYLLRQRAGGEPEHVLVVNGAPRSGLQARRFRLPGLRRRGSERAWRGRHVQAPPQPAGAPHTRATVIDPVSLSAERQAQAWLEAIDAEAQIRDAFAVINRALFAQRIAKADAAVHAVSPAQALAIRAGFGAGEQVADGHWSDARELHWAEPRPRGRVAALRPQERFAALLGGRTHALICEELALRARQDLEQGRTRYAALELERAYAAALSELPESASASSPGGGPRPALARWLDELEQLRGGVAQAATAALRATGDAHSEQLDEGALRHALSRLEAALRELVAAS
jgi:hypothetical protein